jgi:hypothetical protein
MVGAITLSRRRVCLVSTPLVRASAARGGYSARYSTSQEPVEVKTEPIVVASMTLVGHEG